jgi:hypothetical protein
MKTGELTSSLHGFTSVISPLQGKLCIMVENFLFFFLKLIFFRFQLPDLRKTKKNPEHHRAFFIFVDYDFFKVI